MNNSDRYTCFVAIFSVLVRESFDTIDLSLFARLVTAYNMAGGKYTICHIFCPPEAFICGAEPLV